jgi:hypothetical protein
LSADRGSSTRLGAVSEALPWSPEVGRFHLFSVDIEQVTLLRYDSATGDQHLVLWPPGRETVRRSTSATSVGDPEDVHAVLVTRPSCRPAARG